MERQIAPASIHGSCMSPSKVLQAGVLLPTRSEEAILRANATDYGLGGSVWSTDISTANELASKMMSGTVWVNDHASLTGAPFGGFKESGIGRDGPRQAADFFTEEKATITAVGAPPIRKLGSVAD